MSKKIAKLLPLHKKWFIEGRKLQDYDEDGRLVNYDHEIPGGIKKGYSREKLEKFFSQMEEFGKYASMLGVVSRGRNENRVNCRKSF